MMFKKYILLCFSFWLLLAFCSSKSEKSVTAAGVVDGDVVTVKVAVSGKILSLNVQEGSSVTAGEVIAEIDAQKIENQIQGLEIQEKEIGVSRKKIDRKIALLTATLDYWKDQVESFERLEKKDSISGDQLEKTRLKRDEVEASLFEVRQTLSALSIQLESIQNRREQLSLLLEDHVVTSPVSGVVLEKFVTSGEMIFPGSPVADILDHSSLFIETFVEESELARLRLGESVNILVDGMGERLFRGTISYFGKKAEFSPKYIISEKERRSLLYMVKVSVKSDLEIFKLGMPVTVRFD
jgi:HlyD family secretion protein